MTTMINELIGIQERVRYLYNEFGQRKQMGKSELDTRRPHYFLLRTFRGENDLLIILNTKRCQYQCHFCQLPAKSSKFWIPGEDILAQFEYVLNEMKHSLSILDRLTLSNEGSILDTKTLPSETLLTITRCVQELRRVRTLVLETRLEFVNPNVMWQIREAAPRNS
jgi:radical SAM enzyme (TIGR01210 family)